MDQLLIIYLAAMIFVALRYISNRYVRSGIELKETNYEGDFLWFNYHLIERYQDGILAYIPLRYEHRHPENLLNLCLQYPTSRIVPMNHTYPHMVREFGPKIEVEFIGFRRVDERRRPKRTLRIELIRCTEKFAIVTAGFENYSYLLVRDRHHDGRSRDDNTIFYLSGMFQHTEEIPQADAQSVKQTEISSPNRSRDDDRSKRLLTSEENVETHTNVHDD